MLDSASALFGGEVFMISSIVFSTQSTESGARIWLMCVGSSSLSESVLLTLMKFTVRSEMYVMFPRAVTQNTSSGCESSTSTNCCRRKFSTLSSSRWAYTGTNESGVEKKRVKGLRRTLRKQQFVLNHG